MPPRVRDDSRVEGCELALAPITPLNGSGNERNVSVSRDELDELIPWLSEVLTKAEQARLTAFLNEPVQVVAGSSRAPG